MSHQYHRMGIRELAPQIPHPRRTGFSTTSTILTSEEKTTAWQARWERDFRGQWIEFNGQFYPTASICPKGVKVPAVVQAVKGR